MSATFGIMQKFVTSFGPWFLHNKNVSAFLESTALVYDSALQTLDMGLRLSQPLRCDEIALPVISRDRRIRFYPSESTQSKRIRLSQWKQLHRQRATHIGELRHAQPYFTRTYEQLPLMRIVHQSGGVSPKATWHTLLADGPDQRVRQTTSHWNWDGQTSQWSRFWVICYAPAWSITVPEYGDGGAYDDGGLYAGAATAQVATDLVAMIQEWKAAHSAFWGYIIATDPNSFDPTATATTSADGWTSLPVGNWGQPLSRSGIRTRLPSAIWLYDRRGATPA
jgi:hypothetical protein